MRNWWTMARSSLERTVNIWTVSRNLDSVFLNLCQQCYQYEVFKTVNIALLIAPHIIYYVRALCILNGLVIVDTSYTCLWQVLWRQLDIEHMSIEIHVVRCSVGEKNCYFMHLRSLDCKTKTNLSRSRTHKFFRLSNMDRKWSAKDKNNSKIEVTQTQFMKHLVQYTHASWKKMYKEYSSIM